MDIVKKAFEKAKGAHAIHTPFALANHIEAQSNLSARTLLRLHKKYVQKDGSKRRPTSSSIDELCKYLGYGDYGDFIRKRREGRSAEKEIGDGTIRRGAKGATLKKYTPYILGLAIGSILLATIDTNGDKGGQLGCMTWADTLYIKVTCDNAPPSIYGTEIVPLDPVKLKNFKKVKVDLTTEFFSEQTGRPMIWYFITKEGIEYYTAPGLHPINGKTLKAITEHIVDKYVPIHNLDPDSFLGNN